MAEKQDATGRTHAPSHVNPYGRVDEEVAEVAERDERRKKRMKCFVYLVAFIVFQTAVFLIFGLTIMKVRTPRFRVRSVSFEPFNVTAANSSFNIRMLAELEVKNANFGQYKYQNSTIEFHYRGNKVGEALVPRARAKARSTRKFNVTVNLSLTDVPTNLLAIPLTSQSRLRGKVEIMKIMKKKKSTNMNCTMEINTSSGQLGNISCR